MIRPGDTLLVISEDGTHGGLVTVVEQFRDDSTLWSIAPARTTTTVTLDLIDYQE